ncbi:Putative glycoside hydrolase [Sinomonas atrocyanea]|uniref:Putative glycoside hydrolase n=1 Tax=Sinomonas atrocyanea TaxID=37927 RepID=A0A126ZWK7_9MICC|nr:6-phospho-beta-glucosidase [Sinomonas atrocyanea]AMM31569.1 Putative glycoside hydrolase [Sinomonas atrocyanea]GEB66351.1 6-phospho-beta-glucosidase [Sinomonas atrocyanea]GGG70127.1 6-phospho-beta-glucosidase [Sinomonas atrocyanea]
MKLAILGGGGFRTPYIYRELLRDDVPFVEEVVLFDIDERRLHAMRAVLAQLRDPRRDAPRITTTTDARIAIAGASFVFAAIRVGGLEERRCDEHIALDLGVLGQETTGPGGIAFAIRTIPVMLSYARLVKELAPDAFFLNFTNPAGIITEALQSVLGDRVVGICDTPSGLIRRVAALLDVHPTEVSAEYVGLNHLGWLRAINYDGHDLLPELIADDTRLNALEEGQVFGLDWVRALGAIPNEYLFYYYFNREAVRSLLNAPFSRGDYLARSQQELFARLDREPGMAARLWFEAVSDRNASYMAEARGGMQREDGSSEEDLLEKGYAGVAIGVMRAIVQGQSATMILNVRNGSTIAGLPDDAVIEVPASVDSMGVHALPAAAPDLDQLGLMQQVKAVERHAIAAAVHGDRSEALKAFALHPLVDSVSVGTHLLAGYLERIPGFAAAPAV